MDAMGDPVDMFDHTYAEMPPHLKAQKNELTKALLATAKEGKDG
jgi:hypothetical protein